jgi:mono/diheme cytochrome c family protein
MRWRPDPLLAACALLACTGSGPVRAEGAALYAAHCVACHQPDGNGAEGLAPPLAGVLEKWAKVAAGREYLAQVVVSGMVGSISSRGVKYNGNMPSAADLSDAELSAVMGYVMSSFNASPLQLPATLFASARSKGLQPAAVRRQRERLLAEVGE